MKTLEFKKGIEWRVDPLCQATTALLDRHDIPDGYAIRLELVCKKDEADVFVAEILTEDRWIAPAARGSMTAIPESEWLGVKRGPDWDRKYKLWATDTTAILLRHQWKDIQFADEIAFERFSFLLLRFFSQDARAQQIAQFREDGSIPLLPSDWLEKAYVGSGEDRRSIALSGYQRLSSMFIQSGQPIALFHDRGLGKTAEVINGFANAGAKKRREGHGLYRVLVICPGQARLNWVKEIGRFAPVQGKVVRCEGTRFERTKMIAECIVDDEESSFSVAVLSFDSYASYPSPALLPHWDLVVVDESHKMKSHSTRRWKELSKLRARSKQRVILSGTPMDTVLDLWAQLEFLDHGLSGFATFKGFADFYTQSVDLDGTGVTLVRGTNNFPLLQERLSRVSFCLTKAEAGLDIVDKLGPRFIEVEMEATQKAVYQQTADRLYAELEGVDLTNKLTIQHVFVRLLRLSQITSGHVVWDAEFTDDGDVVAPARSERLCDPSPKVRAIVEDIQERLADDPTGKTIIFAKWRPDCKMLAAALKEAGIGFTEYHGSAPNRDTAEEEYNCNPEIKAIVCSEGSAAEALDLLGHNRDDPANSHTDTTDVMFMSLGWSSIRYAQAADRGHRRASRRAVTITHVIHPGTIDDEIIERVESKTNAAQKTTDLRGILQRSLGLAT